LDEKTRAQIERGKRIVEVFKQPQYRPIPVEVQVAVLWAVQNAFFDDVAVERIKECQDRLTDYLQTRQADLLGRIRREKALGDDLTASLKAAVTEFKSAFK
ncbi:MAG TPA: F0F1 ATP synthase subunit alpha, partial [Candidatus Paceibacterota bacterium]|nr:F0F1 ATP synthase subunit alpha [Candidatus Paceibacterota bacterium]